MTLCRLINLGLVGFVIGFDAFVPFCNIKLEVTIPSVEEHDRECRTFGQARVSMHDF